MWHHKKATNQTSEISLSHSLSLSLSLKELGITYSFRSVHSSTQILTAAKWLLPLCMEMLTLVRIYLDFPPPNGLLALYCV